MPLKLPAWLRSFGRRWASSPQAEVPDRPARPEAASRSARCPNTNRAAALPPPGVAGEVVLYSRAGCHLCDVAAAELRQAGLQPKVIDIDQDPRLQSQFDQCVPVVAIDGKVRFRGAVSRVLLRRLLDRPAGTGETALQGQVNSGSHPARGASRGGDEGQ